MTIRSKLSLEVTNPATGSWRTIQPPLSWRIVGEEACLCEGFSPVCAGESLPQFGSIRVERR